MICNAAADRPRAPTCLLSLRRSYAALSRRCNPPHRATLVCMSRRRELKGLRELSDTYQGILLDQFGVLHDGKKAYPEAANAVQWMHKQGLKVLILSNSSKRSTDALQRIQQLGFDQTWFTGAITSGEVTHDQLSRRPTDQLKQLGSKCLHFTWKSRGTVSLEGLGLQVVTEPSDAEFILCHGTEALAQPEGAEAQALSLDSIKALLDKCADQGMPLPMVVANPDVVTVSGTNLIPMPGTLAEHYAGLGGQVLWMGKPDPVIYNVALEMLQLPKEKVIAIGDSLQHDIQGACNAGVDSVFITSGIHAKDLAATNGTVSEQKLLDLFVQHKGNPTFNMSSLVI